LGGLVCFISYQVRKKLHETKAFENLQPNDKYPFIILIHKHLAKVLMGIGIMAIMGTSCTLAILFMPTYLATIVKLSSKQIGNAVLIAVVGYLIAIYLIGYVIDKVDVIKVMFGTIILLMVITPLVYWLLNIQFNLTLTLCLFSFCVGLVITPTIVILSKLFPTNISLTGVAFSYNLGYIIFGGFCPFIIIWSIAKFKHIFLIPVIATWLVALISIYALFKCKEIIKNN
jgi:MFS family permease